jgi:hypothetical protein
MPTGDEQIEQILDYEGRHDRAYQALINCLYYNAKVNSPRISVFLCGGPNYIIGVDKNSR